MNPLLGLILFGGVAAAAAGRASAKIRPLLLNFSGAVFGFFPLIRPGHPSMDLDPVVWGWVDMTLLPAALLTGGCSRRRGGQGEDDRAAGGLRGHAVRFRADGGMKTTKKIETRFVDGTESLVTELVDGPLRELGPGDVLVEMLYVPMHGSFWLASHPAGLHPRRDSFLRDGRFVFGNGGVGRVVAVSDAGSVQAGDFVAIFGHMPCGRVDCRACTVRHRYTECEYGESGILGHGDGAPDGTYARHAVLPPGTYEVCFRADERPDESALLPFMYAFLVADVRNALTRGSEPDAPERVLLFGAGQSGRIAAYLLLSAHPQAKFVVVEASAQRSEGLRALNPVAIAVCEATVEAIAGAMSRHFDGRRCDLIFDASSGDSAPLWTNTRVLSPGCRCVAFGFGSCVLSLDRDAMQMSGLTITMSRGVGSPANRRTAIALIKSGGAAFLDLHLRAEARRLTGLDEAIAFVREQHAVPRPLSQIPQAYIAANPDWSR